MVGGPSTSQSSRFARCVRAFEEEFDYIYRLLCRYGVPRADAEDAVQEVFAVMWRRWDDFRPDRPLRPWLAGIAVRRAYKYLGRRGREVPTAELDTEQTVAASLDERVDARALLRQALAQVPETNRSALVLHDLDGMPMPDVARALSIPLATAYTRVGRGRRALVKAARTLQSRSRAVAPLAIAPDVLLAVGRKPVPVPPQARARALERMRRLDPALAPPWMGGVPRASVALAGAFVVALLVVPRLSASREQVAGQVAPAVAIAVPPPVGPPIAGERRVRARVPSLRAAPDPAAQVTLALGPGLAGYWRFDEGRGNLVSRDLSAGRQDCVLRGLDPESVWLDGALGRGVDVQRGWIECPQPPVQASARTPLSVAAWVRATEPQPGHTALVARQLEQGKEDFFFLGLLDGKLKAFGNLWGSSALATPLLPLQRWVHVALTHAPDGSTRLYQDGVQVAFARKRQLAERVAVAAPRLTIGSGFNGPGEGQRVQQFAGAIDELAVYDRALTAEQVAALAAGAQPPASP